MHRLHIKADPNAVGEGWHLDGRQDGLDQIADYAVNLGKELGVTDYVYFEVFWPWETEAYNTWDAVRVDLNKLNKWDGENTPQSEQEDEAWWVATLPPYSELTQEQRDALGIEGEYA